MMELVVAPQDFEAGWWGSCQNTYGEETKQLVYARYMQLTAMDLGGPGPEIDLGGYSVIDVGGGPSSLLLKCRNAGQAIVVDPCPYPAWVAERYLEAGIDFLHVPAEAYLSVAPMVDEIWIYNVLQHVEDPEFIVRMALERAKTLRIFEWLDIPPHPGHPQQLRQELLEGWLRMSGNTGFLNEGGAVGSAFWGVFPSE
jgi:hypothetical protein